MNNGDKIRKMSNEDLAMVLMCPFESMEDVEMECDLTTSIENKKQHCYDCVKRWLDLNVQYSPGAVSTVPGSFN